MALRLVLTGLVVLQTVTAQRSIPWCLQACLKQVGTDLCDDKLVDKLNACVATECPTPPATQNLIASLDVSFTPKAELSCQQAYGPSNADKESSSVTLPLNGTCATSPYEFKSYLPQGVSRLQGSSGCKIMVFSQEDCLGQTIGSDLDKMTNSHCVFNGGRSARLACADDLDAARAYIQTTCRKVDDGPDDSSSSSTTIYPSSAPYHGPGPVSIKSTTSSSIPFHWPFSTDTTSATQSGSTDTADATGTGLTSSDGDFTSTYTFPSATGTVSINFTSSGSSGNGTSATQNGTQTSLSSPDSQNATSTYSLTLTGAPTATSAPLPPYTGLAAACFHGGAQMTVALGIVGAGFAVFL